MYHIDIKESDNTHQGISFDTAKLGDFIEQSINPTQYDVCDAIINNCTREPCKNLLGLST